MRKTALKCTVLFLAFVVPFLLSAGSASAPFIQEAEVSTAVQVSGNFTICAGQQATLQATGADFYAWSSGQLTSSVVVSPAVTSSYTLTGTFINGSPPSIVTVTVTVILVPTVSVNSATICAGESATLTANVLPSEGVGYLWQPGAFSQPAIVTSPMFTTQYTVTANLNGCVSNAIALVTVMANSIPLTAFTYKQPACINEPALQLQAQGFTYGGHFTAAPELSINDTTGEIDPAHSSAGTYLVTYIIAPGYCMSGGTGTASLILEAPPVLLLAPEITIPSGSGSPISVSGASSYTWSPLTGLSCSDCASPVAAPAINTRYCVTGKNSSCASTSCIDVVVGCEQGDFSLPNAFTPNGDGYNDEFCLRGWERCIDTFKVLIFDRWGEKVYESDNPSFCWDGRFNGAIMESDVVVYSVTASFTDGTSVSKKGNITLLR